MSRTREKRVGEQLHVNERPVKFTYWPILRRGRGRATTQTQVFTNDPWGLIRASLNEIENDQIRTDAEYYFEQSVDFQKAYNNSTSIASKPLLLYYCMMNLVKTLLLKRGFKPSVDEAKHGLQESNSDLSFENHKLVYYRSSGTTSNLFDDFYQFLTNDRLKNRAIIKLSDIVYQILNGHRIMCSSTRSAEKFISLKDITLLNNDDNELWMNFKVEKHDLRRLRVSVKDFLKRTDLKDNFSHVSSDGIYYEFELDTPITHGGWPSDYLEQLSNKLIPPTWVVLSSSKPYRKYYAYMANKSDNELVLPQLASIYAFSFYLSSITRYRPSQFKKIMKSNYSTFVSEFINNQLVQFVYLVASEFAKRDVVKPSIV
ncbi:YaaC family protein [Fodinibius sp. N2]|uniref:YaaC family protein n=1 Tax=Fodinibius alkaliphilus TaxID=3140241 RepID=UPI00315AA9AC